VSIGRVHEELPYCTLTSVEGRIAETIHLPQGGMVHGYMVMYPISKHMKYLREYQVYQPDIDHLLIRVVESESLPPEITKKIIREMKEIVGNAMDVQIQKVASIPLTRRGKRSFVCSDVCVSKGR
jgi:phenylacetate-coenzyme A ligase PaaK-like adenylate-forming protein